MLLGSRHALVKLPDASPLTRSEGVEKKLGTKAFPREDRLYKWEEKAVRLSFRCGTRPSSADCTSSAAFSPHPGRRFSYFQCFAPPASLESCFAVGINRHDHRPCRYATVGRQPRQRGRWPEAQTRVGPFPGHSGAETHTQHY